MRNGARGRGTRGREGGRGRGMKGRGSGSGSGSKADAGVRDFGRGYVHNRGN